MRDKEAVRRAYELLSDIDPAFQLKKVLVKQGLSNEELHVEISVLGTIVATQLCRDITYLTEKKSGWKTVARNLYASTIKVIVHNAIPSHAQYIETYVRYDRNLRSEWRNDAGNLSRAYESLYDSLVESFTSIDHDNARRQREREEVVNDLVAVLRRACDLGLKEDIFPRAWEEAVAISVMEQ